MHYPILSIKAKSLSGYVHKTTLEKKHEIQIFQSLFCLLLSFIIRDCRNWRAKKNKNGFIYYYIFKLILAKLIRELLQTFIFAVHGAGYVRRSTPPTVDPKASLLRHDFPSDVKMQSSIYSFFFAFFTSSNCTSFSMERRGEPRFALGLKWTKTHQFCLPKMK